MTTTRRRAWKAAAAAALAAPAAAATSAKKVHYRGAKPETTPLYSPAVSYGNLLFISGRGVNDVEGIKAQTTRVLDEIQKALESAGSSMEKVLKCNVYLADLNDYAAMNEAYRGRFGAEPPVRTTVAVSGIPLKGAVVEIDVMAHI